MAEVALRQLLYSEEIIPVVLWPPGRREGALDEGLRVRPGVRKRAFSEAGAEIAIAAEESVAVVGLVLEPRVQGALLYETFAGGLVRPFPVLAASGSYSSPVISAALARADPRASPLAAPLPLPAPYPWGVREDRGGFLYAPGLVAALRRQLSWALEYHLSGAGGALGVRAACAAASILAPGEAPVPPPGAGEGGVPPAEGEGGALLEERARYFIGELARIYPQVSAAPAEFFFRSSALLDIFRVGGQGAFRSLVTEGREAPAARRFLVGAAQARVAAEQLAALRREDQAAAAEARQLLLIIEDKLGTARAAALEAPRAAGGGNDDPEAVLGRLAPKERKLVEVEYENRRAAWEAEVNNKCPHVGLAFRMRRATSAREALRLLGELAAFFVPVAPSLRRARDPDPRRPGAEDWLICKHCGFRALCPHVRELVEMEGRGLPYETVRTRLMKYAVRYSDRGDDGRDTRTTYSYFCRICSERLSEFTQEDRTAEIMGAVGALDQGLRRLLWGEALAVAELARFPMAAADPRLFATAAADACHPLLLAAEATLARRGGGRPPPRPRGGGPTLEDPFGDDDDTPDTRTRLYAIIFAYAFLLNLIRSSAGNRDGGVGFEGVRPGAPMRDYARAILQTIARKHRALLAQLEDITEQFVADRFREAYRLVANGEGPQVATAPDEAAFLVRNVTELDPIYRYLVVAARVFGGLPPARPTTPAGAAREFETALGPEIPALLLGAPGKKKKAAPPPELAQMLLGIRPGRGARRAAIEYPPGADLLLLYGAPEINFYASMYTPPSSVKKRAEASDLADMARFAAAFPACSATCVRETVVGGRAPRPPPKPSRRGAKGFDPAAFARSPYRPELSAASAASFCQAFLLFSAYTTDTYTRGKWESFAARLQEGLLRERGLVLRKVAASLPNFRSFPFDTPRRFGLRGGSPTVGITFLYDEEGLPHTWANLAQEARFKGAPSIYVYADAEGERQEMTREEVAAALAAARTAKEAEGPLAGRRLVDVRCSICRTLLSEVSTLDPAKALASLRANHEFDAFYAFYGTRCPLGDFHAFPAGGAGGACSKCGLEKALVFGYGETRRIVPARAYYERFRGRYREDRGEASSAALYLGAAGAPGAADLPSPDWCGRFREFAEEWRYDFGVLVKAAEAAEVPVAALEALGATEGRPYADVLSGAGAPPPPTSADDPRLLTADGAVRLFTTSFNRLRFVYRFVAISDELRGLLEAAGVPPYEYRGLEERLPDVFEDYQGKRAAMLCHRPPAAVLSFTIESLARMIVAVADVASDPPWLGALSREFLRRIVGEIVQSERLLSKPGPFNFKIFGAEEDEDIDPLGTALVDDVPGVPGEDLAAEKNPFSLEEVDIAKEDLGNLDAQ